VRQYLFIFGKPWLIVR